MSKLKSIAPIDSKQRVKIVRGTTWSRRRFGRLGEVREARREKEGHARCNGAKVRTCRRMERSAIDEKSAHDTGRREGQTRYEVEHKKASKPVDAGCPYAEWRRGKECGVGERRGPRRRSRKKGE